MAHSSCFLCRTNASVYLNSMLHHCTTLASYVLEQNKLPAPNSKMAAKRITKCKSVKLARPAAHLGTKFFYRYIERLIINFYNIKRAIQMCIYGCCVTLDNNIFINEVIKYYLSLGWVI